MNIDGWTLGRKADSGKRKACPGPKARKCMRDVHVRDAGAWEEGQQTRCGWEEQGEFHGTWHLPAATMADRCVAEQALVLDKGALAWTNGVVPGTVRVKVESSRVVVVNTTTRTRRAGKGSRTRMTAEVKTTTQQQTGLYV